MGSVVRMKKLLALLFVLLAPPAAAQTIPSGLFGSINYWGVGGLSQVLNPGLAGQCLTTQGVGSAPVWVNCQVSSLTLLPSINTNQFYGNVSGNFAPPIGVDVNTILNTVGYDIARPPPVEAILYKSNVGPLFNWQALPPSTQGSILTSGGPTNPPFWAPNPIQANLSGICTTVGAVLYFDTPSLLWKCLSPGTSGQLLQTGGAGANPSWLTVTLATLGGVPSTRNVNTSSPLGGGGALSSDLTLNCPTCATTTNGGPLSATSPVTISAGGVLACATCATTTNGGALSATAPLAISAGGVISITSPLPIANGGTNAATQQAALNNIAPTPTRAGDIIFWNGSNWVNLAGNNSGTQILQETAAGAPSWVAAGAGTVNAAGTGISLTGGGSVVNLALTNATVQANPANPTGTANGTGLMMGLGTTCHITPVYSTRVMFAILGDVANSSATSSATTKLFFGTGTAPANAAAITGTQIGNQHVSTSDVASGVHAMPHGGVVTGLTVGTAYWFDISLAAAGGTATATSLSCNAMEF